MRNTETNLSERNSLLAQLDTLDGYSWQERCRSWQTHETCGESVYQVYMAVVDASRINLKDLTEHIKKLPPMFLKQSEVQSQHWESQAYQPSDDDPGYDLRKIIRENRSCRLRQD